MSQGDKSALYQALTRAGWKPEKHYREYSTADLEGIANDLLAESQRPQPQRPPEPKGSIQQEPSGRWEQPAAPPLSLFLRTSAYTNTMTSEVRKRPQKLRRRGGR